MACGGGLTQEAHSVCNVLSPAAEDHPEIWGVGLHMGVFRKQGNSSGRGFGMQAVLEMSLGPQNTNAFLSLHLGVPADNPGASVALARGITEQGSVQALQCPPTLAILL